MELIIPATMLTELRRASRERSPREACGAVFGRRDGELVRLAEVRNVAADDQDFMFDPEQQLDIWRVAEGDGLVPRVLWHSHPTTEAYPSRPDQACMALHADLVHVIADRHRVRAFRWDGGVVEVDVVLTPGVIRI